MWSDVTVAPGLGGVWGSLGVGGNQAGSVGGILRRTFTVRWITIGAGVPRRAFVWCGFRRARISLGHRWLLLEFLDLRLLVGGRFGELGLLRACDADAGGQKRRADYACLNIPAEKGHGRSRFGS